jgi:hypothetical protein
MTNRINVNSTLLSNKAFKAAQEMALKQGLISPTATFAEVIDAFQRLGIKVDKPRDLTEMAPAKFQDNLITAIELGMLQGSTKMAPLWELGKDVAQFRILMRRAEGMTTVGKGKDQKPVDLSKLPSDDSNASAKFRSSDTATVYALGTDADGNKYAISADGGYYQLGVEKKDGTVLLLADGTAKVDQQGNDTPIGPYTWHEDRMTVGSRAEIRISNLAEVGKLENPKAAIANPETTLSDAAIAGFARRPDNDNTNPQDFTYYQTKVMGHDLTYRIAKNADKDGNRALDGITLHWDQNGAAHPRPAVQGTVDKAGKWTNTQLDVPYHAIPIFEDQSWTETDPKRNVTLQLGLDGVANPTLEQLPSDQGFMNTFGKATQFFDDDFNSSGQVSFRTTPDVAATLGFSSMKIGAKVEFAASSDTPAAKMKNAKAVATAVAMAATGDGGFQWSGKLDDSLNYRLERVQISKAFGELEHTFENFAGLDKTSIAQHNPPYTGADLLGARFSRATLDQGMNDVFKSLIASEIGAQQDGTPSPMMFKVTVTNPSSPDTATSSAYIYVSKPYNMGTDATKPDNRVILRVISGDFTAG